MVVQMPPVKMGGNDYLVFVAPHFPCQFQADFVALFGRYLVWLEALVTVPSDISACLLVLLFRQKPLLLIGEDGANLLTRSKPIAFIANGQYWVNNHAHVIDSSDELLLEYVATYINAINLAPYVTGTAQPKMNQEKMNSILIPIPPTGEQFRIVQKINQIFSVIANM